jgi:hypothetical protein
MTHLFFALCALVWGSESAPVSPPSPTVAIASLASAPADTMEARLLADALASSLQGTGKVRLLERSQMDRILGEQGLQASGACENGDCVVETGKLLGVERLVVGRLTRLEGVLQLDTRLVDVGTGEVLATSSRRGPVPFMKIVRPLGNLAAMDLAGGGGPPGDAEPETSHAWIWWTAGGAVAVGTVAAVLALRDEPATTNTSSPAEPTELRLTVP